MTRYLKSLSLLIILLKIISAEPSSSFSFSHFSDESEVQSKLALLGGSKVVNGSLSIESTGPSKSRAGRVFYRKPIKLVEGNPKKMVSFSTRFAFSMSARRSGDGLAFVAVPLGFPLDTFDNGSFRMLNDGKFRTLCVEFDTKMDEKYRDSNHVGSNLNRLVSVRLGNVSKIDTVLKSGEKLQTWIDYEAGSRRLEIRLNKLGKVKPVDPLLSCPIDLSHAWKREEVLIGLSSSNGNSSLKCDVYSWSFRVREVPRWMHSEPLDPEALSKDINAHKVLKGRDCLMKVLVALIFGVSCGALGTFFVVFVWTLFGSECPVIPEDYPSKAVQFEPEKMKVVVEKSIKDGDK